MKLPPTPVRFSWLMIAIWATTPVFVGDLLDAAVHDTAMRWLVASGAWSLWATTLTASLIRRPVSLTTLRLGTSAGATLAIVAGVYADASVGATLAGAVAPMVAFLIAMSAEVGALYIDGASYGDERRFALRAPIALVIAPIPMAWIALVLGTSGGPLLLASQRWISGSILTVVGWLAAFVAFRALSGLARRWVVFVPAGVVVHDPLTAREPFLMVRGIIASIGAASADEALASEDLIDATQDAPGLVLMIELHKAVEVVPRPPRGEPFAIGLFNRAAVVPTRPGAVIAEAESRAIG